MSSARSRAIKFSSPAKLTPGPVHANDAFPIHPGDVACFVGGGGKTSLLYGCGEALARAGLRVLSTTTTRVETPSPEQCTEWAWDEDEGRLLSQLGPLLARSRHVALGRHGDYPDRFVGVSDDFVARVVDSKLVDVVLVEGDGARQRHLKAPKEGEPVAPRATTLYVPIVGMDVLGKPLTEAFVHRTEIAARLAEVPVGTMIDSAIIAKILLHPQGIIREAPLGGRVIPFLSFCDAPGAMEAARWVGRQALICGRFRIRRVVLGTAHDQEVREVIGA